MQRGGRGGYRGGGSGRGGRSNGQTSRNAQRGLFADGIWHCDCKPRLPAEHFKVKKAGPNQGRWFRTCQQHEQQRCGFFLWDDDATPREEAAVLNNSRTEPRAEGVQDGWNAERTAQEQTPAKGLFARSSSIKVEEDDSTDSPDSSPETLRAAPRKSRRSARDAMLNDEDNYGLHRSDDDDLDKAINGGTVQTPRKIQKTGVYATPATTATKRKIPWLEEPATPSTTTNQTNSYFDTPSKQHTPAKGIGDPRTPSNPPLNAAAATPAPAARHRDAFINPDDSASTLAADVLTALSGVNIPPDALSNLRSILSRHELRAQGVIKGREISRAALRAKDAKIVDLESRIGSLQADWEYERVRAGSKRRKAAEEDGSG